MITPESFNQHPIWEGAVVGILSAAELGMMTYEQVIPAMGQLCIDLIRQGMLDNLGGLQGYLRKRRAFIQLVAQPFDAAAMPRPDLRCVDIVTDEPRGHWLMVSVGPDGHEATMRLQALGMSDEINEATLARDTGMLSI